MRPPGQSPGSAEWGQGGGRLLPRLAPLGVKTADPRGYEKLSLERNARRMKSTQLPVRLNGEGWRLGRSPHAIRPWKHGPFRDRHGLKVRDLLWTQRIGTSEITAPDLARRRSRIRRAARGKRHCPQATKYDGIAKVDPESRPYDGCRKHPPLVFLGEVQESIASRFRKLQIDGDTGTHTTPIDNYCGRYEGDEKISLYEYVCRSGGAPVFTGAAIRPPFPPSDGYARDATLHKPWRFG